MPRQTGAGTTGPVKVNVSSPNPGRREFLSGLFGNPAHKDVKTELGLLDTGLAQGDGVLWAMAADSPDNLFVAGDDGQVLNFNGADWHSENIGNRHNIHGLCLVDKKLYSVGWMGQICVREAGLWKSLRGGGTDGHIENLPLFDITNDRRGELWAVGDQGRVTQFNGKVWIEHKSGTSANLRAVLCMDDGRVLVSGLDGTALVFEDGIWSAIVTNCNTAIVSMALFGSDQVIAVGGEYDLIRKDFSGKLFLYSEGEWKPIGSEALLPRLRRVRRHGSELLITGDAGAAFRWTTNGVVPLHNNYRYDLHDVISFGESGTFICGDFGAILQEAPRQSNEGPDTAIQSNNWVSLSKGETQKTLRTLWPIDERNLIAAGDAGVVLHFDGNSLTLTELPEPLRIHDIWGSSPKNIYAVCDQATIFHFDGNSWDVVHRGRDDTALLAIAGFGPHDIFAVGDNGCALRYDGLMWRKIETGVTQELYALWGQDSQHILAVGGGGLVLRWNGEQWKQFAAGTDYDLYGVTGSSLNQIFLCGLAGTLIAFEDNTWRKNFTGVRSDLHAVAGVGEKCFTVGSNGTILGNVNGDWIQEKSGTTSTLHTAINTESHIYAAGSNGVLLARKLA
jgi:hypothetical protein